VTLFSDEFQAGIVIGELAVEIVDAIAEFVRDGLLNRYVLSLSVHTLSMPFLLLVVKG
jgi:hypothetical protein